MLTCSDAAPFIARAAEDPGLLDAAARSELELHLRTCANCRTAFDGQREVAALLRSRPPEQLSAGFAARLSARLDDTSGWFGIADWRVWTFRLAPVVLVLSIVAFMGAGGGETSHAISLEEWARGAAGQTGATAVLWEPDASPDSVLETILTGQEPDSNGESDDVR